MQPRLSNQLGVNNCLLSKLQSFSVHMMMCESSTAASLRSNICHLFPFKSWKWCLNFSFLLFFIYGWKLAWEIAGQNFPYIMVFWTTKLFNAQTFKESHSSIIKIDYAFPQREESAVSFNSVWLYQLWFDCWWCMRGLLASGPAIFIAYIFSIAYTRWVLAHAWNLQSHKSHSVLYKLLL